MMLLAASSKRSKNWRSLDTSSCDRRGMDGPLTRRRRLVSGAALDLPGSTRPPNGAGLRRAVYRRERRLRGIQARGLDPRGDGLGERRGREAFAQGRCSGGDVLLDAALLDLAAFVVPQRVGGTGVPVERDSHAAGIH